MTAQTICFKTSQNASFHKTKLLKAALVTVFSIILWEFHGPIMEMLSLIKDRDALINYLGAYGRVVPVLLFIILFLQVIVAAIPGHVFMLTSGYLLGFFPALFLIHTSTVLSSQMAYWLARKFGRPVVEKLAPTQILEVWTQRAERQGTIFFIISFILPIFPSDVMIYIAGLSCLSNKNFWTANFLGRLPTSILFSLIGAQGFQISLPLVLAAAIFTIGMLVVWRKITPRLG